MDKKPDMISEIHTGPDRADLALIEPAPLLLSGFGALRREPTRPLELRDADFEARFDHDTLFYDGFRLPDRRIALLGPPFLNLKPVLEEMSVTALPSGRQCRFRLRELDRHGQIIVEAPEDTTSLSLRFRDGAAEIPVQGSGADAFAGRRVLFTLSKNNRLHWIRDWICYGRDVHGADAVLFYDNGSTDYAPADILDTIAGIDGIAAARVVDWPFKYGPQGTREKGSWDSDFCQHGALEHARWRFLQSARSAQNADIDELVVSRRGRSVFAAAEAGPFGIVAYPGRWVVGTRRSPVSQDDDRRTHRDYDTVLRRQWSRKFGILPSDGAACPPKWTVVPSRCPAAAQWSVHSIVGWLPSRLMSPDLSYRHFREISDGWKYRRADRQDFDPALHEEDRLLRRHFGKAGW